MHTHTHTQYDDDVTHTQSVDKIINQHVHLSTPTAAAAVDTSGAGDCFIGAALFALSRNTPLREAMTFANAAAGISVCRRGTQKSYPTLKEVEDTMKDTQ